MGNDNKVKNIILVVLVIGLVSMTVAYAALTQTLTISDNQVVISTGWDVHFAHREGATDATAYSAPGEATTATITQQPTMTATSISGLRATFRKPGDQVDYEFDIVNDGTIDAKLTTATYTTPTCTSSDSSVTPAALSTFCQKISYTIKYTDVTPNVAPAVDDELPADPDTTDSNYPNVRHCILTVKLDPNTEATDFPGGDITVSNIGATFVYSQK